MPKSGRGHQPGAGRGRVVQRHGATVAVLAGFLALSKVLPAAHRLYPSDLSPLLVQWDPATTIEVLVPIALAGAAVVLAPKLLEGRRWILLASAVAFGWLFAVTVAIQSGSPRSFPGDSVPRGAGILTAPFLRNTDYLANVPLIARVGIHRFDSQYPHLERPIFGMLSLHAQTHPPGAPLLLFGMEKLVGGSVLGVCLLVTLIGALGAVPTYFLAREAYGERIARRAVLLFVSCPAVILYSATSMDVVFMTAMAAALAGLVRAPRSNRWAVGAGLLAGLAVVFTWSATALLPIGVGVGLVALRRLPMAVLVRRAGLALAGLLAAGIAFRVFLSIDLVACFRRAEHLQTTYRAFHRPYWYWVWGNVFGFLIASGIGHTALLVEETRRRWRDRDPGIETVLWGTLILSSVLGYARGETDHIWLVFTPLLVAAAAAAADRVRPVVAAGLGQAVATEMLFWTNW